MRAVVPLLVATSALRARGKVRPSVVLRAALRLVLGHVLLMVAQEDDPTIFLRCFRRLVDRSCQRLAAGDVLGEDNWVLVVLAFVHAFARFGVRLCCVGVEARDFDALLRGAVFVAESLELVRIERVQVHSLLLV